MLSQNSLHICLRLLVRDALENQDIKVQPGNFMFTHKAPEFNVYLIASINVAILRWMIGCLTWKLIMARKLYDSKCLSLSHEISMDRPYLHSWVITCINESVISKITRYQQLLNFQLKNFNILNNSVPLYNIVYLRSCHLANNRTKPEVGKGFLKNSLTRWRNCWQDIRKSSLANLLGILSPLHTKYMLVSKCLVSSVIRSKYGTDESIFMLL